MISGAESGRDSGDDDSALRTWGPSYTRPSRSMCWPVPAVEAACALIATLHDPAVIRRMRDERGVAILLVEHAIRLVMDVCDRITVLSYGRKIAEGRPDEIRTDAAVIEAYLGRDVYDAAMRFEASLDMRYVGQAFELAVPFDERLTPMADVDRAFYAAHEQRYSHATDDPAELVSVRVAAYGAVAKPAVRPVADAVASPDKAIIEERAVVFDGAPLATRVYGRDRLPLGTPVAGPALIEESGTTTVVPPGFEAAVDPHGNLVLERR